MEFFAYVGFTFVVFTSLLGTSTLCWVGYHGFKQLRAIFNVTMQHELVVTEKE